MLQRQRQWLAERGAARQSAAERNGAGTHQTNNDHYYLVLHRPNAGVEVELVRVVHCFRKRMSVRQTGEEEIRARFWLCADAPGRGELASALLRLIRAFSEAGQGRAGTASVVICR